MQSTNQKIQKQSVFLYSDSNDKLTFVKLMKLHKCHELMPQSAKLVLLDSELEVSRRVSVSAFSRTQCCLLTKKVKFYRS